MIELHRPADSAYADEVERRLRDLVLAHEVHVVGAPEGAAANDNALPLLREGQREYRRRAEIDPYLDELSREVVTGRQLQSDSCVIDPDDPSQCL